MGDDSTLNKMKVADLRSLAKEIGVPISGKEKKADILSLMEKAVQDKLASMPPDEAGRFTGGAEMAEFAKGLTGDAVKSIFGIKTDDVTLESIGEELVSVEQDVEGIIRHETAMQTPDMADIYAIDQKLAEVVKMNVEYASVAGMLDVGRIKFLDRKYVESMGMLSEAMKSSEELFELYSDITVAFIILSAEKILEECRDSKVNNEQAADQLIHAKRAFSSRGKARTEAVKRLTETASEVHREEVAFLNDRIASVEQSINAKEIQGVDVFNAKRYLHRARESYLTGELSSVSSYLDKSMSIADDSERAWIHEIQNDIPRVESILKQAKELGADVSAAEKHLAQAKTSFENGAYSLCAELKKLAERKAIESQHEQIQKAAKLEKEKLGEAERILGALIPLVREAEVYGIQLGEMSEAMRAARDALSMNDYVNALTYARDAESRSKAIWTQVKAQRESILASGEQLQPCQQCRANGVKVFMHISKAVCANCGMVYDLQPRQQAQQQPEKKGGWFRK